MRENDSHLWRSAIQWKRRHPPRADHCRGGSGWGRRVGYLAVLLAGRFLSTQSRVHSVRGAALRAALWFIRSPHHDCVPPLHGDVRLTACRVFAPWGANTPSLPAHFLPLRATVRSCAACRRRFAFTTAHTPNDPTQCTPCELPNDSPSRIVNPSSYFVWSTKSSTRTACPKRRCVGIRLDNDHRSLSAPYVSAHGCPYVFRDRRQPVIQVPSSSFSR